MSIAFTIGNGKRSTDFIGQGQSPGPGAYKYDKQQKQTPPSFKVPQANRQAFNPNKTPGPGAYAPQDNSQAPKFSFGIKKATSLQSFQPGPGAYNPKLNKDGPQFSISAKYQPVEDPMKPPGPGAYDVQSSIENGGPKFPKSQRQIKNSDNVPGPGGINILNQKAYGQKYRPDTAPRYRFGTSLRQDLYDSEAKKNPGPGSYYITGAFENPEHKGFTLISRRDVPTHDVNVPGPGAYDPDGIKRPPSCKIGKEQRGKLPNNYVPGPGQYENKHEVARPSSAMVRIGSAKRKPLNEFDFAPGPGTYEIPNKMIEGPKVSILGHKYDPIQNQKDQVPGPGTYESKQLLRPQSAKIGTSRRNDLVQTGDQPGPGNYFVPKNKDGPKWSFGTGGRPPLNPKNDTPGPGGYDAIQEFGNFKGKKK